MMRGSILRLLSMMLILRDNAEGGGGGGATIERPEHITEEEWSDLSQAERESQVETDEGEGAHSFLDGEEGEEGEEDDLPEDVLKAIAGQEEPGEKTAEELAAEAAAASDDTAGDVGTAAGTEEETPEVTDEDLLAWRAQVSDAEVPIPKVITPELQAKLDELDAKLTEADEWFEKGEKPDETPFTKADLRALERQINKDRQDINDDILQHRLTLRETAKVDVVWQKEQAAFRAARPDLFKSAALEGAVVAVTNGLLKDPKNNAKSGMQIMIEAERIVRKDLGLPAKGKPAAKETQAEPEKKPAAAKRTAPNLSKVPVADQEATNNPFSAILRLSGEKYEKAIESMSATKRAEFEAWANRQA